MAKHLIYWPLLAQMAIPIMVLLLNGKRKAADVKAGSVNLEKVAMDNEAWSKSVVLTSKNLANQFQFPVIFYVLCLMLAGLDAVSMLALGLAWAFVASRAVHVCAHVADNIIKIRMPSFMLGIVLLIALFVVVVMAVYAA